MKLVKNLTRDDVDRFTWRDLDRYILNFVRLSIRMKICHDPGDSWICIWEEIRDSVITPE